MKTPRSIDEIVQEMNDLAKAQGKYLEKTFWQLPRQPGSILDVPETPESRGRTARLRARRIAREQRRADAASPECRSAPAAAAHEFGNEKRFSPRKFLKARRPERFSDSVLQEGPTLDRSLLEYHLETLTKRSGETDFQRFAFELAKREICPNLLPQTGPTGGGDSKVDTETYPVTDNLALVWYIGTGTEASKERWAFAFSTKEDWLAKVKSDVAKIAGTNRGYVKAIFITSQFVPDKRRAEIEDNLRAKHGLDVRIHDRNWILDRVFTGRHQAIAVEQLRLAGSLRSQLKQGPLDLGRERELEVVQERINVAVREGRLGIELVDDCIETALLARSLERPRTEVEGLFARAERVAKEYGSEHQRLKVAYDKAWTVFWWHEDYTTFSDLYEQAEGFAKGSQNVYDLELLSNLWFCLHSVIRAGELKDLADTLVSRTRLLECELDRLSKAEGRASAVLQARTLRLHMQLQQAFFSGAEVDPVLRELQDVVRQCDGLVGYPLQPLVEIVGELGAPFGDRPAYNQLFETVTEIASRRKGEVTAARMLVTRGVQHQEANRTTEAIRTLGRALTKLYKHESREDVVRALFFLSSAYQQVGLLWAARGSLLAAGSIAANDLWTYGQVTGLQAASFDQMKWLELQLGRVPHALAYHEIDRVLKPQLVKEDVDAKGLGKRENDFDIVFGMLLLKSELTQLPELTRLPDVLDELGLIMAADCLRFALGHKIDVADSVIGADGGAGPGGFFSLIRQQPAFSDLPEQPDLYLDNVVTIKSRVLGCRIKLETDNVSPCVELAESFVAALESLVATGLVDGIAAREPILTGVVRKVDTAAQPFEFELKERAGMPHAELRCRSFPMHKVPAEAQQGIRNKLRDLLANLLPRLFFLGDYQTVLTILFRDDRALERSINFTTSFVTLANMLGETPKTRITDWSDPNARSYPVLRSAVWDAAHKAAESAGGLAFRRNCDEPGRSDSLPERIDLGRARHDEMELVSPIREELWNEAVWSATLFLSDYTDSQPPGLAPAFKNDKAGHEIFAQWRQEIGEEDRENQIRVLIVRGISKKEPHSYRVVIGANPRPPSPGGDTKLVFSMSRVNTMVPQTSENLDRFLRGYHKVGAFYLLQGVLHDGPVGALPVWDNCILKKELVVKEAWQIGANDPDRVALQPDDDPIIPAHQPTAPVLELLEAKGDSSVNRTERASMSASHELSPRERAEQRKATRRRKKRANKNKRSPDN